MKFRTLLIALLILPAIAMACVDTSNGDFCVSFTDVAQRMGAHEFNLTRTYDSQALTKGWFGYGWETPFETHMTVMPDGSVAMQELGVRKLNYYAPKGGGSVAGVVDKIIAVAIRRDKLEPEAVASLRSQLLINDKLRVEKVVQYGIQTRLSLNAIAQSGDCVSATVKRTRTGYRRNTCGQGIEYFDLEGRLVRKIERDYKFYIHYAGKYPDRIEDSVGRKLFLKWTASGNILEARADKHSSVASYEYDDHGNLQHSIAEDGMERRYGYDDNHRMTLISYTDSNNMEMQYDEKGRVIAMTESDGSKNTYTYLPDPENPLLHYWVKTTVTRAEGDQSSREDEYWLTVDASGVIQPARMIRTEGQRKKETIFDKRGRIQHIDKFDGRFTENIYHPNLNKITKIYSEAGSTVFKYNDSGDLVGAYNSQGQIIKLDYNKQKRISRMVETNITTPASRRELTLEYNAQGLPTRIKMVGKGAIKVAYDKDGEISKVESKQGAVMALEVSMAFKTLLNIVKAGSVELY